MIATYGDAGGITPDQIKRGLSEHDAYLWIGNQRLAVSRSASDDELKAAVLTGQKLAAEAAFMVGDLEEILRRRTEEREARESAEHAEHATGPQPAVTAGDPEPEEPYGGADPDLDAKVRRLADTPDTHRKTETEDE